MFTNIIARGFDAALWLNRLTAWPEGPDDRRFSRLGPDFFCRYDELKSGRAGYDLREFWELRVALKS